MLKRAAAKTLLTLAKGFPVVAITGPRQSGKTTLARSVFSHKKYVSLEDPDQLEFVLQDPRGFLSRFPDGALIDEAQRYPQLFSFLQTRVDEDGRKGLFVLTGSQQFGLLSGITQTLAGRSGLLQLMPFSLAELKENRKRPKGLDDLLFRGLYPPLYDRKMSSGMWYANYVLTYIERDVRQLLSVKELSTFQRFVRMCAARTGQILNLTSLGNDCGITHNTAKAWLSVLEASYLVFLLYPHYRNFGKRLVKSPKLYFYDTGLAAWLLNIQDAGHLSVHPARSSLLESLVVSELLKSRFNRGLVSNLFFWRDNTGTEVDIIAEKGNKLIPVEVKSGQTVTQDYFAGLNKWGKISGGSAKPYLVYGGDESMVRAGVNVISWRDMQEIAV